MGGSEREGSLFQKDFASVIQYTYYKPYPNCHTILPAYLNLCGPPGPRCWWSRMGMEKEPDCLTGPEMEVIKIFFSINFHIISQGSHKNKKVIFLWQCHKGLTPLPPSSLMAVGAFQQN